jgi:hypothetical protein
MSQGAGIGAGHSLGHSTMGYTARQNATSQTAHLT